VTTHVALVRHHRTDLVEPATRGGVFIVGTPVELWAAFGDRLVTVAPARDHLLGRPSMTVPEWLAA
jgi:hypothetical protein